MQFRALLSFFPQITPGLASYLTCKIDTSALDVVADLPSSFKIYVYDAFLNPVLGGDDVKVCPVFLRSIFKNIFDQVLINLDNPDGTTDQNVAKVLNPLFFSRSLF